MDEKVKEELEDIKGRIVADAEIIDISKDFEEALIINARKEKEKEAKKEDIKTDFIEEEQEDEQDKNVSIIIPVAIGCGVLCVVGVFAFLAFSKDDLAPVASVKDGGKWGI